MRSKKEDHHIDPYSDPKDPSDVAVKSGGVEAWRQHDIHTSREAEDQVWVQIAKKDEKDYSRIFSFPEEYLKDIKAALSQIMPDTEQRTAHWEEWQSDWHKEWVAFSVSLNPFEWHLRFKSDLFDRKRGKMSHTHIQIGPFRFYSSF